MIFHRPKIREIETIARNDFRTSKLIAGVSNVSAFEIIFFFSYYHEVHVIE